MDPGTGLTVLGTAIGSAKVLEKMLGPTADYLGNGIREWTERSVNNVGRVFKNAEQRLGGRIDSPGSVPPKVLKGILEEAPFCDDELSAEYFGGVLASSRSEVGRDDRGASFISLLGRLSTYQIRTHYFFYSLVKLLYEGVTDDIGLPEGRVRLRTFVPYHSYVAAMEFGEKENVATLLGHVLFGLARESLIEDHFRFGKVDGLKSMYPGAEVPGIVFAPSALGIELFFWAHGHRDLVLADIGNPAVILNSDIALNTLPTIRSVVYPDRSYPAVEDKPNSSSA